ncbi:lysophospholipid acyltransferase family protein [Gordonia phthalatica]|uniref:Acyl-phosphate glycerol 3-phosphate acyltransferase n=1 Tax=Gordonia phthalatica TaxID=1136941 RepID=A0A0N9NDT9_9ACTN|nr:lysophospholipid acyltransferase family protein [Gordonia phthalatica]ALG86635.1 acyl-phosphate glycerol 3-phosphate acyltransferase [Gordonia phthalatica]
MDASIWVPSSPCGPHCVHTYVEPVSRLRATMRVTALGTVGLGLLAVGILTVLLPRVARHGYWRGSAKIALRTMGVELDIDDHRPDGARRVRGALMVANHVSFLDIIALCCVAPARFVAKREVLQMGVFGPITRAFGVLPHRRGDLRRLRPMIDQVSGILDRGRPVAVFPEGTTWCGTASGRFKPAFFQAAIDAGVPVLPVRLSYTDHGHRTTMPGFLGEDTIGSTLSRIVRSRDLTITVTVFEPQLPAGDRGHLAAVAQELIAPAEPVAALQELAVDLSVPAPAVQPRPAVEQAVA